MSEIIITQTVSPKNYCKYERTMCEFANDRGYCVKTGCSKRITINEKPYVNKNLVEVVRCKDCLYWDEEIKWMPEQFDYICKCVLQDRWTEDDEFCSDGTRKEQEDGNINKKKAEKGKGCDSPL